MDLILALLDLRADQHHCLGLNQLLGQREQRDEDKTLRSLKEEQLTNSVPPCELLNTD